MAEQKEKLITLTPGVYELNRYDSYKVNKTQTGAPGDRVDCFILVYNSGELFEYEPDEYPCFADFEGKKKT